MMKITAMAAGLTALILGAMGATAAAGSALPATGAPAPAVVNLHHAYELALPHARAGRISGVAYPPGRQPRVTAPQVLAACAEPDCPLTYHGGPVQHSPRVYLLLWGPNWTTDPAQDASYGYLYYFFASLGAAPGDTWSGLTSQYGDGSAFPTFGGSVFAGAWQDSSTPPAGATQAQLAAEADGFASAVGARADGNAQIVVATQSGTDPQGFCTPTSVSCYCAWHSFSSEPYINLPYLPDAGASCGENVVRSQWDGFSIVGGHEYAETITDPMPGISYGWADLADPSGGEIGDKCAWQDLGALNLSAGSYAMQPLWSNAAGRCQLTADRLSIIRPGTQSTSLGAPVRLQVHATSTLGRPVTYTAAGLPPGLSISATTGLITGKPTFPGNYTAHLAARDATPLSASATFAWRVNVTAGPVRAWYHAAHCVNDASLSGGSKVVLYTCNGSLAQSWAAFPGSTLRRYGGTADINTGKCLDISGGGTANGTAVDLQACNGRWNQQWTYAAASRQWRNPHSGKCLTDPATRLANGTQLVLWSCTGGRNEQWTNT